MTLLADHLDGRLKEYLGGNPFCETGREKDSRQEKDGRGDRWRWPIDCLRERQLKASQVQEASGESTPISAIRRISLSSCRPAPISAPSHLPLLFLSRCRPFVIIRSHLESAARLAMPRLESSGDEILPLLYPLSLYCPSPTYRGKKKLSKLTHSAAVIPLMSICAHTMGAYLIHCLQKG